MKMSPFTLNYSSSQWQFFLESDSTVAEITQWGWDTEGTGRHTLNLLKYPTDLSLLYKDKEISYKINSEFPSTNQIKYRIELKGEKWLYWHLVLEADAFQMKFSCDEDLSSHISGLRLYVPFEPRTSVLSIIANTWNDEGTFQSPFIISAPDLGQLAVSCDENTAVIGNLEGNRKMACLDLMISFAIPGPSKPITLKFTPLVLPLPAGFQDESAWKAVRRGWFNLLQFSCGASGGDAAVKGVWANNTLSDPVSSLLYMLGDVTLLLPDLCPGVSMLPLLRRALKYWMDFKTNAEGLVAYTAGGKDQHVMDSNPALLIGAWCYVQASRDTVWLAQRIDRLEFIAQYMESRDIDADGIIESTQSGNYGSQNQRDPDCAWDCYLSGHKNAYVNALIYRAWYCMATLENQLDRRNQASHYIKCGEKLKDQFVATFFNPTTGWLGFWRSEDGQLHEIYNDSPTSLAINYGLLEPAKGRPMLKKFWARLEQTKFHRFDLGIPLNIEPVPRAEMNIYFEFQQFLNGGCCVSNAAWIIDALNVIKMTQQADLILDAMIKRQKEGPFPNGGGFQNGFVDKMGKGAEVFDWEGRPAGYEGHLVYCWAFLQSLLLKQPAIRKRLYACLPNIT